MADNTPAVTRAEAAKRRAEAARNGDKLLTALEDERRGYTARDTDQARLTDKRIAALKGQ